jgi:hypothetical protein
MNWKLQILSTNVLRKIKMHNITHNSSTTIESTIFSTNLRLSVPPMIALEPIPTLNRASEDTTEATIELLQTLGSPTSDKVLARI